MNTIKKYTVLSLAVLLSGCASSAFYPSEGAKKYDSVSWQKVKVYAAEKIEAKYEVIGSIAADDTNLDSALEILKKKAGDRGANAIINTRVTKLNTFTVRAGLSGTAVRLL